MISELGILTQSVISWLLFVLVFFSGYLLRWFFAGKKLKSAEGKAKQLTDSAKKDADSRRKEAELQGKDLMIKLRQDFETESKARREEIMTGEKRLQQKEENIDKRVDLLERKEKDINTRLEILQKSETGIQGKSEEFNKLIEEESDSSKKFLQ